jgi:hypothetical protein
MLIGNIVLMEQVVILSFRKFLIRLIDSKQGNNELNFCRVCGRQWKKTIKLLKKVLTQALRKIRWMLVQSVTSEYL